MKFEKFEKFEKQRWKNGERNNDVRVHRGVSTPSGRIFEGAFVLAAFKFRSYARTWVTRFYWSQRVVLAFSQRHTLKKAFIVGIRVQTIYPFLLVLVSSLPPPPCLFSTPSFLRFLLSRPASSTTECAAYFSPTYQHSLFAVSAFI